MTFKRKKFSNLPIEEINILIACHEQMVKFYEDYLTENGEYDYINERINYLYSQMSEYLIARDLHIEEKTYKAILNN